MPSNASDDSELRFCKRQQGEGDEDRHDETPQA